MFSLYDLCVCGHPHPEHTAWGNCRGCSACPDDSSDHPFQQCPCRTFALAEATADEPVSFESR
jgi:hypothetical protein